MTWPNWLPRVLVINRKCPRCHGGEFKAAELRPFDQALAMFALRPIRCKFCWRRYYWFALREYE